MSAKSSLTAAAFALFGVGTVFADAIPYPNPGTPNPRTYTFTATTSGDLIVWFVGDNDSPHNDFLGVTFNGMDQEEWGLGNHSSYGASWDYGFVKAGTDVGFLLAVEQPGLVVYPTGGPGPDGVNHAYATTYSGDAQHGIPAGFYLGFEDQAGGGGFTFTAEQVVFSNMIMTSVPEPAGLAMLLAGLGLMGAVARRRGRG